MSKQRRRWLMAVGAVVAIAAGGWLLAAFPRQGEVSWVEARIDDLVIGVEIEGSLQSRDSSFLGPPAVAHMWDYKISFLAPEGVEVEAGTPVLGFDVSELERRLRERQTESEEAAKKIEQLIKELERQRAADKLKLAEAQARARKARLKVEVPEELEKEQVLEDARLDLELAEIEIGHLDERLTSSERSGRAALEVLRSKKNRADQQVREIQDSIERMTIKAPRSGTTIYVTNWQGEKKKVGDSCWRGQQVIELPDLKSMMAKGEVDEADAGMIREGQAFRVRLDAHPDVEYTGHVASIWQTVQRKSWRNPIKIVRLDMDLNETDPRRMRPGMRFRGNVEIERLDKVLVVPSHAVFLTPRGPVVFRRTLLGHEKVPVKLGRRNDELVQVVEGLEPGDHIAERDLDRGRRAG
jgi:multidrug efflux pump subunit AcrA (membrane-fusion protein)